LLHSLRSFRGTSLRSAPWHGVRCIAVTETLIGLITFFIGLLIGNRMAIGRDKRKEFNSLTSNDYWLLKEELERKGAKYFKSHDIGNLTKASQYYSFRRNAYIKLLKSYEEASSKQIISRRYDPRARGIKDSNLDKAKIKETEQCIRKLLTYIKPR